MACIHVPKCAQQDKPKYVWQQGPHEPLMTIQHLQIDLKKKKVRQQFLLFHHLGMKKHNAD